jgi:hypothetical protein
MTCDCAATDRHFGTARAQKELAAYRRHGPKGTARLVLRLLRETHTRADTLLDIGAGIGILHHELLADGVHTAVHVEAARAYVRAAQEEASRRSQAARVQFLHGDFLALAPTLMPADLVTLDRVVCCYPELDPLLVASAARARRYWAASFPRDRWYTRLHARWQNHFRARAGNAFRTFVHPVARIYDLLSYSGLRPLRVWRGPIWEVVICIREDVA